MLDKAWERFFGVRFESREIIYIHELSEFLIKSALINSTTHDETGDRKFGITGAFLFDSTEFIRTWDDQSNLAGELYEEIAADPRHMHVTDGPDVPIKAHAFIGRSMRLATAENLRTENREGNLRILQTIDRGGLVRGDLA